jgi:FlaA1/EpsC-like NDP-sugar epimerase
MIVARRLLGLIVTDSALLAAGAIGARLLLNEEAALWKWSLTDSVFSGLFALLAIALLLASKTYKSLWKYTGPSEVLKAAKIIGLTTLAVGMAALFVPDPQSLLPVLLVQSLLSMLLLGGFRLANVHQSEQRKRSPKARKRAALIVGAGAAGTATAKHLLMSDFGGLLPIGFIDDNVKKQSYEIVGIPVLGTREDIPRLVSEHGVTDIIVAIPSAPHHTIKEITAICKQTSASVNVLPGMEDVLLGRVAGNQIREVDVKDLLGREMIQDSMLSAESYIRNKTVLITGAGGSIGSELVNQVAQCAPKLLVLLGHGENSIHAIEATMKERYPAVEAHSVIADIQNADELAAVFRKFEPSIVFHAAAHKHVPLMENNPAAAVMNNVFGTRNVVDCAIAAGVGRFVQISTDKAVEPINVMGLTKRLAEMIILTRAQRSDTTFSIVRFGNVLESRGSVIPIFKKQIAAGGPVTVTHPDMVRYFMTIPEAVHLVLQAGALSSGGEIFVLDMGKPVRIVELAKALIRYAGYVPDHDVAITFTGMRPGEKLSESLFYDKERILPSRHPRIFIASPKRLAEAELDKDLAQLKQAVCEQPERLKLLLEAIVHKHSNAGAEAGESS